MNPQPQQEIQRLLTTQGYTVSEDMTPHPTLKKANVRGLNGIQITLLNPGVNEYWTWHRLLKDFGTISPPEAVIDNSGIRTDILRFTCYLGRRYSF